MEQQQVTVEEELRYIAELAKNVKGALATEIATRAELLANRVRDTDPGIAFGETVLAEVETIEAKERKLSAVIEECNTLGTVAMYFAAMAGRDVEQAFDRAEHFVAVSKARTAAKLAAIGVEVPPATVVGRVG